MEADFDTGYNEFFDIATEEDRLLPEIWELTIPGRVIVAVHLSGGVVRHQSRQGVGQRLRLTAYDRKVAQEQIRVPENDPFTNGMLVRVDQGRTGARSHNELDDPALGETFALDDEDFETTIDSLSEVNLRRLKGMARTSKARQTQVEAVDAMITAKWPIGGDTPSNREARGDTE